MPKEEAKKPASSNDQKESKPKVDPKWMGELVKGGKVGKSREVKTRK